MIDAQEPNVANPTAPIEVKVLNALYNERRFNVLDAVKLSGNI